MNHMLSLFATHWLALTIGFVCGAAWCAIAAINRRCDEEELVVAIDNILNNDGSRGTYDGIGLMHARRNAQKVVASRERV